MNDVKAGVYFEEIDSVNIISNIRNEIINGLTKRLRITPVLSVDVCDFIVSFCPNVSRLGTDIENKLSHIKADKPTIVMVLHHKLIPEVVQNSSRYDRPGENLILLDFLFSEDMGLLDCENNKDSFGRAEEYMRQQGIETVNPPNLSFWMKHRNTIPWILGILGVTVLILILGLILGYMQV